LTFPPISLNDHFLAASSKILGRTASTCAAGGRTCKFLQMYSPDKSTFAEVLRRLVHKFDADKETYLSPGYGEAQARSHFVTPFFKALSWDVENEESKPYHLCDVWEEKGETHGRPDYTFRVNGETKFFIEAKAPSVSIGNAAAILQTKSYAWNSRDILFAGLTHFEEFRFFDASLEPDERSPLIGEAFHLQYTEYLEKIDLIWELSKEKSLSWIARSIPKKRPKVNTLSNSGR
jgi:hypothetical protein